MPQTAEQLDPSNDVYIGRQPIFDENSEVMAYELLYRNGTGNFAEISCEETATSEVLVNSFLEIGFDALVGKNKAFINIPRGLLLGEQIFSLPKDRVVLEVLENVTLDKEVKHAMKNLRDAGYTLALDDFIYTEEKREFIQFSDIIKVDLLAHTKAELIEQVSQLKQFDVTLLAEKVETKDEHVHCKSMGFELFQGYYYCKPEIVKGTKMPSNKLAILQLITRLFDQNVELAELEKLIVQDVSLSFKLIKVTNSAAVATSKKIESIKQAINMLGLNRIRNWVSFILFSGVGNKPFELFRLSMVRAKMCELLALDTGERDSEKYFTVGLFSNLDSIMDQTLEELLDPLPLTDDVKNALLHSEGKLGSVLSCVEMYEKGDWDKIDCANINAYSIKNAYLQSLHWVDDFCANLAS